MNLTAEIVKLFALFFCILL